MSYANRTDAPPDTLSDEEVRRLLAISGAHRSGFRDHVIFSLAVGTGLRESEIVALNVADVSPDGRKVRRTVRLRVFKRAARRAGTAPPPPQRIHLPDATLYKLAKYLKVRRRELAGENFGSATADGLSVPLFAARTGARLSTRRIRELMHLWQERAGFDHRYNFHALRHTYITRIRRDTGDIRIAQVAARHANIRSTTRYEHASDEELIAAVRKVPA